MYNDPTTKYNHLLVFFPFSRTNMHTCDTMSCVPLLTPWITVPLCAEFHMNLMPFQPP